MRFDWLIERDPNDAARTRASVAHLQDELTLEVLPLGSGADIERVWGRSTREPVDVHVQDVSPAPRLALVVPIDTPMRVEVPGIEGLQEIAADTHMWHLPEETWADYHVSAGTPIATAGINFSLEYMAEFAREQQLPKAFGELIDKARHSPLFISRRTGPALRMAVSQLLHHPYHGRIGDLYVEGKGMEIMAIALDGLQADAPPRRLRLSAWEARRIREARERLTMDLAATPTARELASAVGLPVARLERGFRELFGAPMFRWLQNHKLDLARELLSKEHLSIKEIAFRLGYAHPSNFCNAFRRRFGESPGAVRRR